MRQLKSAEEMPGSYGLPILGETLEIFRDSELYLWRRFQQHGSVFKTSAMGRKRAYLIGPMLIGWCWWNRRKICRRG